MDLMFLIWVFFVKGLWETAAVSVTGEVGDEVAVTCSHSNAYYNIKYFCRGGCRDEDVLIRTGGKSNSNRKYTIRNEGNTFYVTINHLTMDDSGIYWCGIERNGVDTYNMVDLQVKDGTKSKAGQKNASEVNSPLFLTAVMCVAAMLFVCVFTLSLLLTIRYRRSGPSPIRQTSADYETMMPSVRNEPEPCCTCPDCVEVSAFSPSPPNISSDCGCKQRESIISVGMSEYASVCVPEASGQYQCLAVSKTEDKVYHNLHGKRSVEGA